MSFPGAEVYPPAPMGKLTAFWFLFMEGYAPPNSEQTKGNLRLFTEQNHPSYLSPLVIVNPPAGIMQRDFARNQEGFGNGHVSETTVQVGWPAGIANSERFDH